MPRSRPNRTAADRLGVQGTGRTVACGCGKRLALLWPIEVYRRGEPISGVDGAYFDRSKVRHGTYIAGEEPGRSRARHGLKDLSHEDWVSIKCPKCGADWQGREEYLGALVAGVAPGQRVTLGTTPRPAWQRHTSLRW